MKSIRIAAPLGMFLLVACGRPEPPPPSESDRTLEKAIQAPMDRARAVEEDLKKARNVQDAKLEEQGG
jgi:hypothetical protein